MDHQLDISGREDQNEEFEFDACRDKKLVQLFNHESINVRVEWLACY